MDADGDAELAPAADQLAHLAGHPDADRVGKDDLVRARADRQLGHRQHARRVHRALKRAAERGGDDDRDVALLAVGARDDLPHVGQ